MTDGRARGVSYPDLTCDLCTIGIGAKFTYKEPVKIKMKRTLIWKWRGEKDRPSHRTFHKGRTYKVDEDCYKDILKKLEREDKQMQQKEKITRLVEVASKYKINRPKE